MRKWSVEEINYLIDNYQIKSNQDIGMYLNRTRFSIDRKATKLGLVNTKIPYRDFIIEDGYCKYPIRSFKYPNMHTLIDIEDINKISEYKCFIAKAYKDIFYAMVTQNNKNVAIHTLLTGQKWVDHKNRNSLDNRKENLRPCTQIENLRNRSVSKNKIGGYKYVYWKSNNKKWEVSFVLEGKYTYIGLFDDELEAAKVADQYILKNHGNFSVLNFQNDLELELNNDI